MKKLYGLMVGMMVLLVAPLYAADDVKVKLTEDAGVSTFAIQNSTPTTVFQVDSLGNVALGAWNATTIPIGKGGTGQTTANAAFNALAPSQAGNSGEFLTTDAANTSWAYPIPDPVTTIALTEEFCGGSTASLTIGALGWTISLIGVGTAVTARPGEVNRWGIARFATAATINTGGTMQLANVAATLSARPEVGTTIKFALKINSADLLQTTIRIGIAATPAAAQPTDGIYFEYVSAAAASSWIGVCRAGGAQSVTGNLLAGDLNTWHRFQIRYDAANSVYFSVDGGAESQVIANIPANTVGLIPSIKVVTTVAAIKNIDIDYYQIILTGITR